MSNILKVGGIGSYNVTPLIACLGSLVIASPTILLAINDRQAKNNEEIGPTIRGAYRHQPLLDDPLADPTLRSARQLYNDKKFEEALVRFDTWISTSADIIQRPRAVYESALTLYRLARYKEAVNRFKAVGNDYPNSKFAPISMLQAGNIEFGLGDYDSSEHAYEVLASSPVSFPEVREARFLLIQVAFNKGDMKKTFLRFKDFHKQYPADVRNRRVCDYLLKIDRTKWGKGTTDQDWKGLAKDCTGLPESAEGTDVEQ